MFFALKFSCAGGTLAHRPGLSMATGFFVALRFVDVHLNNGAAGSTRRQEHAP
jgi:hypothetical protein